MPVVIRCAMRSDTVPSGRPGEQGCRDVAGMIRYLIAAVLQIEVLSADHPECQAGQRWTHERTRNGGRDLRRRNRPVSARKPDHDRGDNRQCAGTHDEGTPMGDSIDKRARGCRDEHRDNRAHRQDGADRIGAPPVFLQINAEEGAGTRLDIGCKETDRE